MVAITQNYVSKALDYEYYMKGFLQNLMVTSTKTVFLIEPGKHITNPQRLVRFQNIKDRDQCAVKCKEQTGCNFFVVNTGNGANKGCELYASKTVTGGGDQDDTIYQMTSSGSTSGGTGTGTGTGTGKLLANSQG